MMNRFLFAVLPLLLSLPAAAQDKDWTPVLTQEDDSKADSGPPSRIDPFQVEEVRLKAKERWGVRFGEAWANNPDFPARGDDGSVVFLYGATLPVVVCAPLYVCDLTLERGEIVNDLHIGDNIRWKITPATQGTDGDTTTHVIIKPTDIGLVTNLIATTDRRTYTIKLVSRRKDWMPRVAFFYPGDLQSKWRKYRDKQIQRRDAARPASQSGSAADLDFSYEITGDNPSWRPVRVYSSSGKTYIQFPRSVRQGDLPALVALADDGDLFNEPSKQLVNYRFVNGRFEVDRVLERAALLSGVGWDQLSVRITRRGSR
jgi:type IV secretion system protein VirB9